MEKMTPPVAPRRDKVFSAHGIERNDPYAWLKDENWQQVMRDPDILNPDIREYLEAENEYTKAILQDTEDLQDTLFQEMKARIKEDDSTVPSKDGPFAYYVRYRVGGQQPIYCRKGTGDADTEDILFDGDKEAEGKAFFDIGDCEHSPNHRYLAYCIDEKGSEFYTLRVRDLRTGKDLDDVVENITGGVEWSADSETLFYATLNDKHRPDKIFRHRLGTPRSDDTLVYDEQDPGFFLGIGKTESGRFIMISAHDHETSEVYAIPADEPTAPPLCIQPREPKIEYDVTDIGDKFFMVTNCDNAEDYKVMQTPIASPGREHWTDWQPHQPGTLILDILAFAHHLVRLERVDGLPRIVITELTSNGGKGEEHIVQFDEEAYALGLIDGYEFDTQIVRFSYSSPTTPAQVFDYDMVNRTRTLLKSQEVPSGHDPADYETHRLMAPARDGELVPVTLVHKAGQVLDGSAPLLLYGYGSYGHAIPASFSTSRLSLIDRGFVYAIAHIRGGMERGYRWYKHGKLDHKPNTFNDFIDAAEHLIAKGYTSRGKIIGHGGSAGGMLMGAVANQAPDLFLGIIADVPFVDVLSTMSDDSLPLTPPEWPEWGNPIESEEAYRSIAAYSPYDNVTTQNYPHILITAGLTDPRVTYWEPAKWTAKLRATKTNDNLLLLKTNMDAGHGGASGRFEQIKEIALNYAFALKIAGLS